MPATILSVKTRDPVCPVVNGVVIHQPVKVCNEEIAWKLIDPYKLEHGNTTNMSLSFSVEVKRSCSGEIRTHGVLLMRYIDAPSTELSRQLR